MALSLYLQRPYLLNEDFLKEVDNLKVKYEYAKISLLDWTTEDPIREIQGNIISGNFNYDATSSMRRTGSLSIIVPDEELDYKSANTILSINTKILVEVGIKNTTSQYIDFPILWFPQGYYVLRSVNISRSSSGLTINLSFKDKMCLFNGECGGTLPASVTFSEMEEFDEETETTVINHPTMYQIIQEVANHWGGQQIGKILISDVQQEIKQVVKWSGEDPLYLTANSGSAVRWQYELSTQPKSGAKIINFGDDVGYEYTPFTFPGELIGDAGTPITTILDKIRDTLGNYEYFFDIDGNFRFQEIKNYLNTSYSSYILANQNENEIQDTLYEYDSIDNEMHDYAIDRSRGTYVYDFRDSPLVISYSNNPNYENFKNDFIVWGMRTGVDGTNYPIRYHLAIDDKPPVGSTYRGKFYTDDYDRQVFVYMPNEEPDPEQGIVDITTTDWRTQLYMQGVAAESTATASNDYYVELANEWPKLYDIENGKFKDELTAAGNYSGVSSMDYYLDFIDSSYLLQNYGVKVMGRRSKILVDNSINCIIEPPIADFICVKEGDIDERTKCENRQQSYCIVPEYIYDLLVLGGRYNGANIAIRDLLYQYTSFNESISLTTLPILHLEPNTKIRVADKQTGINGDYIIKTISLSLGVSGTMTITANQALVKT